VSSDGGKTWTNAILGEDHGRFAFRPWRHDVTLNPGRQTIMARASNVIGQTQTNELILNPAGYHHNVTSTVTLVAS
jgi:hypothetical protein